MPRKSPLHKTPNTTPHVLSFNDDFEIHKKVFADQLKRENRSVGVDLGRAEIHKKENMRILRHFTPQIFVIHCDVIKTRIGSHPHEIFRCLLRCTF